MAKANLQNIATSGTFQNWFDKTNEIVNIIKTDTLTAGGDTTNGNAILAGNFTATNVIANTLLQTDGIGPKTGGATIQVNADTKINGASQAALIVSHGTGGQAQFTNGSITWNAGLKDSGGNFIIDTGAGADKFSLATNGMLTVPNVTAIENVTAVSFIGDGSQLTGVVSSVAVNELTDVTITNASSGQVLKYNGTAWVNDTDFDGGSNVNAQTLDNLDSTAFLRSNANDTYTGTLTVTGDINQTGDFGLAGKLTASDLEVIGLVSVTGDITQAGNLAVDGALTVTGDIVTNYSGSDIRLKENLKVIEKPLEKISEISGYTFNYKDKPRETIPGVVAQEVEKVLPNVVFDHERNGGTYKAVRYDQLIPLLIESIKELSDKVNDLEDQLKS